MVYVKTNQLEPVDFEQSIKPPVQHHTEMWGHSIEVSKGVVGCSSCDTYKKVPEIVQGSDELTQVVYKMYMLGKFVGMPCKGGTENRNGLFDKFDKSSTSNITNVSTDNMYFSRDWDDRRIQDSSHYF